MSNNVVVFDPLKQTHNSWTQEFINKYFQVKSHELISSEYVRNLNLNFNPHEVIFRGNNAKSIVLIGKNNSHVITKADIEANKKIERIHTEALWIISGKSIPGFSRSSEAPKEEQGWFNWDWPWKSQEDPESSESLVEAHKAKQAEMLFEETDPRKKATDRTDPLFEENLDPDPVEESLDPEETMPRMPASSPDITLQWLQNENAKLRAEIARLNSLINTVPEPDQNANEELLRLQKVEKDLMKKLKRLETRFEIQAGKLGNEITKRNLAELQRTRTQTHLERILRFYAEALRKQSELQQELDSVKAEINALKNSDAAVDPNNLIQKLSESEKNLSDLRSQLSEKTDEVTGLKGKIKLLQAKLEKDQGKTDSGAEDLKSELRALRLKFQKNRSELESKISENLHLQARLRSKTAELNLSERTTRALREDYLKLQTEFNMALTQFNEDIATARNNLINARKESAAAKDAVREARAKISELESENAKLIKENEKAKDNLKATEKKLDETQVALGRKLSEKEQEIASLKTELRLLKDRHQERFLIITSKLKKVNEEKNALEFENARLNQENQTLKINMQMLQDKFTSENALLKNQIEEERSKLEEMQKEFKAATLREADLRKQIIELKNAQRISAADYQSTIRGLEGKLELSTNSIKGKNELIESLKKTISNLQSHYKSMEKSLQSEIAELKKRLKASSTEQSDNQVDQLKKQLADAMARIEELQKQADQSIKQETDLNTELSTLRNKEIELNKSIFYLNDELDSRSREISLLKRDKVHTASTVSTLTSEKETLTTSRDAMQDQLTLVTQANEELQKQIRQQQHELERIKVANSDLTSSKLDLEKKLMDASELANRINESHKTELAELNSRIHHLEILNQELNQDLEFTKNQLKLANDALEQERVKQDDTDDLFVKIEELQSLITEKDQLLQNIYDSDLSQKLRDLREENDTLASLLKNAGLLPDMASDDEASDSDEIA